MLVILGTDIERILLETEFKDKKILKLGPYSPMLNLIESVLSVIKAYVKRNLRILRQY